MPKKILLADNSDAIRGIAESLLHQNGYDVIVASSLDRAKEFIISERPNMVIIGADIKDSEGKYLYDSLEENPTTSSIPLLLIADPDGRTLPYPDEVILPRPFDPKSFIDKVKLFIGGGTEKPAEDKVAVMDPFAAGTIDDEFLDAALGIDGRIDVESSEIMNKTWTPDKKKKSAADGKAGGFGIHQPESEEKTKQDDSRKVETLMIREDESVAKPSDEVATPPVSTSSKIEIISDQYGLVNPEIGPDTENRHSPHDYNWFINEIQKETTGFKGQGQGKQDKDKLKLRKASEEAGSQEPIQVSPDLTIPAVDTDKPKIKPGGVDRFIADFKKEVEKLGASSQKEKPTEAATLSSEEKRAEMNSPATASLDPEEVHHFCTYLAELLAEKLAKRIVEEIDPKEIYQAIKDDFALLLSQKK